MKFLQFSRFQRSINLWVDKDSHWHCCSSIFNYSHNIICIAPVHFELVPGLAGGGGERVRPEDGLRKESVHAQVAASLCQAVGLAGAAVREEVYVAWDEIVG